MAAKNLATALALLPLALGCVKAPEQPTTAARPGSMVGNKVEPAEPLKPAEPGEPAGKAQAAEWAAEWAKEQPDEKGPPLPSWKHGQNPFVGVKYWNDPYAPVRGKSRHLSKTNPEDSALLAKIADHGGADWIGEWTPYAENWVRTRVTQIQKTGSLPVFIAYNLPKRDCGQYSAGGLETADTYEKWISGLAHGIGDRRAAVIIEPDSLGLLKWRNCLSPADQKERLELLRFAVHAFASLGNTAVYLDAGHSEWIPVVEMAERLKAAGIAEADGFSLNVSNYKTTEAEKNYGKEISKHLGGKHFVIDTGRNGKGPPPCKGVDDENCWCNPAGRGLGTPSTAETGDPLVDAYLWLKKPGESDGTCNGGPKAGEFWLDRALELARNAEF